MPFTTAANVLATVSSIDLLAGLFGIIPVIIGT